MRIRMLFLALAGLLLLSGCAQFMVPTEIGPVMTAEKRAAFYKMVDQGVANTAPGLPMLALINAMLEKKPGLEEMKEKWIPAGIKAESPRVLRRLLSLRRWSHEQIKPFFPRSP